MPDMLEFGQQILAAQPFSVLLEARITAFDEGVAEITVPIQPHLLQQHGFVHGGVLSYAADNALTFAGGSVLGPAVVTSEYKINYVRPARGHTLIARATAISKGKRQAVCRCDLFAVEGESETLCATALGTIVTLGSSSSRSDDQAGP